MDASEWLNSMEAWLDVAIERCNAADSDALTIRNLDDIKKLDVGMQLHVVRTEPDSECDGVRAFVPKYSPILARESDHGSDMAINYVAGFLKNARADIERGDALAAAGWAGLAADWRAEAELRLDGMGDLAPVRWIVKYCTKKKTELVSADALRKAASRGKVFGSKGIQGQHFYSVRAVESNWPGYAAGIVDAWAKISESKGGQPRTG